jgi:hypothetical protein
MAARVQSLVAFSLHGTGQKKPRSLRGEEQGKFSVPLKEAKAKAAELFN